MSNASELQQKWGLGKFGTIEEVSAFSKSVFATIGAHDAEIACFVSNVMLKAGTKVKAGVAPKDPAAHCNVDMDPAAGLRVVNQFDQALATLIGVKLGIAPKLFTKKDVKPPPKKPGKTPAKPPPADDKTPATPPPATAKKNKGFDPRPLLIAAGLVLATVGTGYIAWTQLRPAN